MMSFRVIQGVFGALGGLSSVIEILPETFFMHNSAEHDFFSAYKYDNANNNWHCHIS